MNSTSSLCSIISYFHSFFIKCVDFLDYIIYYINCNVSLNISLKCELKIILMKKHRQKSYKSNSFRQIILQRIYSGELKLNEKIPPCRELCKTYNLSYVTVNKVVKELCNDGILEAKPGRGTIVKSTALLHDNDPRRIMLYDEVVPEKTWNLLTAAEPSLKDNFFPRFVGQYSGLLAKENLDYQADFIFTSDELIETMVQRDMLCSLEKVVDDFAIDLSKYPDKLLDSLRVNGELYALPLCFSTYSFFYNKDMFDEAGLSYPDESWTWEDLRITAKKLTSLANKKVNHFGFAPHSDNISIINFYIQGLVEGINPEKALLNRTDTAGLDFLLNLIYEEKVSPHLQDSEAFITDLFLNGQVAMTFCKYKMVQFLKQATFRWGVTTLPVGNSSSTLCALQGIAINKQVIPTATHVEQLQVLTGETMQKLLLNNFGHLPVFKELAEAAPYSKPFIEQLPLSKRIYLNSAENYTIIKNLILKMFTMVITPKELIENLRAILKHEKYNNTKGGRLNNSKIKDEELMVV